MFERPDRGDQAVLVHIDFHQTDSREELEEFRELVTSAGADPIATVTSTRSSPDAKLFIGKGKVEEIFEIVKAEGADIVLFNHSLTPGQERNLEAELQCRVLDRTGLILDIFAQRAHSFDGKLQVELAQLRHLSTRLVRGWTHLERQKGGIGLRGPGEKQLETDRRLLAQRIKQITQRLSKVRQQRKVQRHSRRKAALPVISLVGYTNAGKSTLFNTLTSSDVVAADQLFATLDPTLRRINLSHGQSAILADTVGFIRHLPHELVAAFQSTLEETREADLLLHIIDASDPERDIKADHVNQVLAEIGAQDVPQIQVFNKIDAMTEISGHVDRDEEGISQRIWLSALSSDGLDLLPAAITSRLGTLVSREKIEVPLSQPKLRAMLFQAGHVISEIVKGDVWILDVELTTAERNKWRSAVAEMKIPGT